MGGSSGRLRVTNKNTIDDVPAPPIAGETGDSRTFLRFT